MDKHELQDELVKINKKLTLQGIRLSLAQAWIDFYQTAYDALLYHTVNFRTLPEFKNTEALDAAYKLPPEEGRTKVLVWIAKLSSGVNAAVRRKGFKLT